MFIMFCGKVGSSLVFYLRDGLVLAKWEGKISATGPGNLTAIEIYPDKSVH